VRDGASSELERRHYLRRLGRADTRHPGELFASRPGQPVDAAAHPQQFVGDVECARAMPAAAEDERHELVVAKRGRAEPEHLLPRPIVGRQVFHRTTGEVEGTGSATCYRRTSSRILRGMSIARSCTLVVIVLLAVGAVACGGDPPDKEMQQAQGAIDAARAAGAEQYAREEFMAAQDALKRANDAVEQRDYRLALNDALDSRERARNAAAMAADGKAAARVEADRAINAATADVNTLAARLKAPEAPRTPARTVSAARKTLADAERRLQEARTAFGAGDYPAARDKASSISAPVAAALKDLDAAGSAPARRRR
jgi:hypothetical protein